MTTATKTPAKPTARKAPAKKAPAKSSAAAAAKPAAEKATPKATTPAARKLRWLVEGGDRSLAGKVAQTASVEGYMYRIQKAGDGWTATVEHDGKTAELSNTTFAKAYQSCVAHNRARA